MFDVSCQAQQRERRFLQTMKYSSRENKNPILQIHAFYIVFKKLIITTSPQSIKEQKGMKHNLFCFVLFCLFILFAVKKTESKMAGRKKRLLALPWSLLPTVAQVRTFYC